MKSLWKCLIQSAIVIGVSAGLTATVHAQGANAPGVVRISKPKTATTGKVVQTSAQMAQPDCTASVAPTCAVPSGPSCAVPSAPSCAVPTCAAPSGPTCAAPSCAAPSCAAPATCAAPCGSTICQECGPPCGCDAGCWPRRGFRSGCYSYGGPCGDGTCGYGPGGGLFGGGLNGNGMYGNGMYGNGMCSNGMCGDGMCNGGLFAGRGDRNGNNMIDYLKCKFGYFIPTGGGGKGVPLVGHYARVYPVNPAYSDPRDGQAYAAQGYGVPISVPLAPVVGHTFDYSWGVPSSRLTPVSHPAY